MYFQEWREAILIKFMNAMLRCHVAGRMVLEKKHRSLELTWLP